MPYSLLNKIVKISKKEFERPNLFDRLLDRYFLWIFPQSIKPNHLTSFRYATIPFIIILLKNSIYTVALPLFLISVLSDAFDGALARTRDQITSWGKTHDPLADKLLVGTIGFILITEYIGLEMIMVILLLELLTIVAAISLYNPKENPGARLPGKIKMFCQSVGLVALLIFAISGTFPILFFALVFFYVSIFFSILNVLFCIFFVKSL